MDCFSGREAKKGEATTMEIVKNRVFNNVMFLLANAGGIHAKLRKWKPGSPDREPAFMHVFRKEIGEGMVFADVGANVGYQTLIGAELIGPLGFVYAIEPDDRNVKLLKLAVQANGYTNVAVHACAVSDKIGEETLHLADATNLSSMIKTKHSVGVATIGTVTLTEFMKDKAPPNFIKMDIEGYEVEAIRGAVELFGQNFPCKILIEVHPQFFTQERNFEVEIRKLLALGFRTKYVISAAVAIPDLFENMGYKPVRVFKAGHFERGLYTDFTDEDMIPVACYAHEQKVSETEVSPKIVRAILLERT